MIRALALSLLLLASPAQARELAKPKLLAVYAYADWCGNCKILSPKLKEARAALEKQDVLFVTLDLTDKPRIHQSILLAQALGIGDWLKAQGSATGYVAVLDSASKKELERFDSVAKAAEIGQNIASRLAK